MIIKVENVYPSIQSIRTMRLKFKIDINIKVIRKIFKIFQQLQLMIDNADRW